MKNAVVQDVSRTVFHNKEELIEKLEAAEADYREGRTDNALEWIERMIAEHVRTTRIN